jgi:hypothetical protein
MKIHGTDYLHPLQPDTARTAPERAGARFREILRDVVSASPAVQRPGIAPAIPPAGTVAGFRDIGDREELLSRADELIALLETLQEGIAGTGLPLKDACTSVRAIEDRAYELAPLVERLPEGDPFREFMNRIVITASVETIKFRRGDYL